jgi:outer membrane protein assembly factor BamD (BamD/ComL family)
MTLENNNDITKRNLEEAKSSLESTIYYLEHTEEFESNKLDLIYISLVDAQQGLIDTISSYDDFIENYPDFVDGDIC